MPKFMNKENLPMATVEHGMGVACREWWPTSWDVKMKNVVSALGEQDQI
jgi:hypothetical protein